MGLFKQLAELEKSLTEIADGIRDLALKVEYQRGFTAGQLDAIAKLAQQRPRTVSQTEGGQNATPTPPQGDN